MTHVLARLLTVALFVLLGVGFFHPITAMTQDLGRHLVNGQIILQTHTVPKVNFFSYTYPNFPFINHHWLSEVIFQLVFSSVGFNGLLVLAATLAILAFTSIFLYCLKRGPLSGLLYVSPLYLAILSERTDVRPELFSFLFLSLFIVILYKFRERWTKLIFLLPLVELFWVNMHIYFIAGIAVVALFAIDAAISLFLQRSVESKKRFITLFAVLLLSSFAALINPNGLKGALYPFHVFENYGYSIQENQTLWFLWQLSQSQTSLLFAIAVPLLFVSLLLTIKKTRPIDWGLAIFFTYLGFSAVRNTPLFVFATIIPFARSLSLFLTKSNELLTHIARTKSSLVKNSLVFFLLLIVIWQIKTAIDQKGFGFGMETGARNAADFFLSQHIQGPIFNNFDIGSYLDYRFYGVEKVFVDGRPEAYPKEFFQNTYIPMQSDMKKFDDVTSYYHVNSIFFAHTDQTPWATTFLKLLAANKKWKIVYLDDSAIIFLENNDLNKKIIDEFGMDESNIHIRNLDEHNLKSLLRLAIFFDKVGFRDWELSIYQKMLDVNPSYCFALYGSSVLLSQKNDPAAPVYTTKFFQRCK